MTDQDLINARACPECNRLRAELKASHEAICIASDKLMQSKDENARLAAALRECESIANCDNTYAGFHKIAKVATDSLKGSTTLRELLEPVIAILDELRCHVVPELATKAENQLTCLRAVMGKEKE